MSSRSNILPGVANARELGGIQIGSRRVKSGLLIRTGQLTQACPEALGALQTRYRVQTVVDFRMSAEHQALPDPVIPGAKKLHLPPVEMEDMLLGVDPALVEKYGNPNMDRMTLFTVSYENGMLSDRLYEKFLLSDRGKRAWRTFFEALLALEEGRAILWHCTDGKDRTGCAAMLTLFALGAEEGVVMRDYLLTNEYNALRLNAIRQKILPLGWPEEKVTALLFMSGGVAKAYMTNAIRALLADYGSVLAYLKQELGVGNAEIAALRQMFLTAEMP